MKLTADEIQDISRSVVREFATHLSIAGVTASDGEADHAELLFTLNGCHDEPCMIMVTVPRSDRETMADELRIQLRNALALHHDRS